MNKWRDSKGAPTARYSGPLAINENRRPVDWPVNEVYHIAPDYERMRIPYTPVRQPRRWVPILAIVAALALVAVIFNG